jgi:hypothetical protein
MRHRRRLDRLREQALRVAADRQRVIRMRACVGADIDQLCQLIARSIRPEDQPILEAIMDQMVDYSERARPHPDGTRPWHGFVDWISSLVEGWGALPERLPTAFLTAWRDGYEREAGWDKSPLTPVATKRCEDCRLVLPNRDADGTFGKFSACPACGGRRISGMNLFKPPTFSLDGGITVLT